MQIRKTTLLITLILIHILAVGCQCKKKNVDPLTREEKRLKNALKAQCEPGRWKKLEATFEEDRNDSTKITQHIESLLDLQGKINDFEKPTSTTGRMLLNLIQGRFNQSDKPELQSLLDFVSPLEKCPEEISYKKADDLLRDLPSLQAKFGPLLSSQVIPMIKLFLTNQLALWRNLKQQLEKKSTEGDNNAK